MKARILTADGAPPPWGEPAASWPVLLRPALDWTREALAVAGADVEEWIREAGAGEGPGPLPARGGEPVLLLPDDLLLSAEFVRDFLRIAATRPGRPLLACLGPGASARRSAGRSALPPLPDGSLPLPLLLWPGGTAEAPRTLPDLLGAAREAEPIPVDPAEQAREIDVPRVYADPGKETMTVAGSTRIALHLRHRSHLQQANTEMLGAAFLRTLSGSRLLLALRWIWGHLRPGPRRLLSRIGKGCRIHPTAIVEGARLGQGCEIGAHAIVRASVLGERACVEDGAHVQMCVLGDRSRVGRQSSLLGCVLMEGAHSTQGMMQMAVLGRHAATTRASWFLDTRFDGRNVRVEPPPLDPPGLLDSGTRFLACDVGHDTVVGAGVLVAAGRMLPGNARIACEPDGMVAALDEDVDRIDCAGEILVVRGGKLVRQRSLTRPRGGGEEDA